MRELEYIIPIADKNKCEETNKKIGTNFHDTNWHIKDLIDKLIDLIHEEGDEGGWYMYDGIKVKLSVKYEPQNK